MDRHADWAELFFDLVAVVGVAALGHVLIGEVGWAAVGLFAITFLAFWLCWVTFMLYGNSSSGGRRVVVRLLAGMFGLGVMAAAAPDATHTLLGHGHETAQVNAFALAYVITRIVGSKSWDDGRIVVDFPIVQRTVGVLPWLISLWVPEDAKVWLWVVGIAIDVIGIVFVSGQQMIEELSERLDRVRERVHRDPHADRRRAGGRRDGRDGRRSPERLEGLRITGVSLAPEHLTERLGLLVIIVLGEGVISAVRTSWDIEWELGLLGTALAVFLALASLFSLSLIFGHAGIPHLREGRLSQRLTLTLHLLVTATLTAISVTLGLVIADGGSELGEHRWLLAGGVACYFLIGFGASLASGGLPLLRAGIWVGTGVVVPLLVGLLGAELSATATLWILVVLLGGHVVAETLHTRRSAGGTA